MKRITAITLAASVALVGSTLLASSADAKDNESRQRGVCSGTAGNTWVAKVKGKDGGIRVDFGVKTQRTGQTWTYELKQNNVVILTSSRVTRDSDNGHDDSGHVAEVKWRKHTANLAGAYSFAMTATRGADNCSTALTF